MSEEELREQEERYERALKAELFRYHIDFGAGGQEEAIREQAYVMGFIDLRGFNAYMTSHGWDYYDILKIASPEQ
jgi:hypothetical protein